MSEDLQDVRSKICKDAHRILVAEAEIQRCDLSDVVREVLEAWALGRTHGHRVIARRLERAGIVGNRRESRGTPEKGLV